MPRDVFNRASNVYGGAFAADASFMTFPNVRGFQGQFTGSFGLLVQNLDMQYSQQITRLYEVGRPAVYYVIGRTEGQIQLRRIQGPRALADAFYKKFGDGCNALTNVLHFEMQTGCGTGTGSDTNQGRSRVGFTCHFCVIQTIGLSTDAQSNLTQENQVIMFSSLEYETSDD